MRQRLSAALVLLVVGSSFLVSAPAGAARPASASVSIKAPASATVGAMIKVRGKVTGRSARSVAVLQRKSGKKWVRVKRTRVTQRKRYAFKVKVAATARYRVRILKNKRIRATTSRAVRVRAQEPTAPGAVDAARSVILQDVNSERTSRGLAALRAMPALNTVAQNWTQKMADRGEMSHNPSYAEEMPSGWTAAAENVAVGYEPDAVVAAWMDSSGHRANILGDYTHIGIGFVRTSTGWKTYFTQVFGKY